MFKNSIKNEQIYLKSINNDFYFEKNKIIWDKTCPLCKKYIFNEKDFCECGFFLSAAKNSKYWATFMAVWFIIGFVFLISIINLINLKNFAYTKINKNKINFHSLSPINIQIFTDLKNSPYGNYIENIYVKQKENNKLIVLIKPTSWGIMNTKDKNYLKALIQNKWKILYAQNYPNLTKKPVVDFANPD